MTMLKKPQSAVGQHKLSASKFFQSVVLTGTTLLFLLKPGISKGNEEIKAEIQKVLKQYPAKEWKVQETEKNGSKIYQFNQAKDNINPDTTTIKDFFLKGTFLTAQEMNDFEKMRKESVKSPSRPATYLTICDIRKTAKDDYEKSVLITAFLDPFQKTNLGKAAFQEINKDESLKRIFGACCKIHTGNIETIKLEAENKQAKEVLALLQQMEEIYKKYLNK